MKKEYIEPSVEMLQVDGSQLLAGSVPEYDGPLYAPPRGFVESDFEE